MTGRSPIPDEQISVFLRRAIEWGIVAAHYASSTESWDGPLSGFHHAHFVALALAHQTNCCGKLKCGDPPEEAGRVIKAFLKHTKTIKDLRNQLEHEIEHIANGDITGERELAWGGFGKLVTYTIGDKQYDIRALLGASTQLQRPLWEWYVANPDRAAGNVAEHLFKLL